MPFGIDPNQVKQVVQDVAEIKTKLAEIERKLDIVLSRTDSLSDHGNVAVPKS